MVKLLLKFKDRLLKEFFLSKPITTIGRQTDNDIVIENAAVSKHHAQIELKEDEFILTDLQSTNGTFVNEKKIKQLVLVDGYTITIGKHSILFSSEAQEDANLSSSPDFGMQTMILDTKQQKELLAKQQSSGRPVKKGACITVTQSGKSREYPLTKKMTVIGKSLIADVPIKGFFMPKQVISINKEGDFYFLHPNSGWITVKLNGRIAGNHVKLYKNDIIEIRRVSIVFQP